MDFASKFILFNEEEEYEAISDEELELGMQVSDSDEDVNLPSVSDGRGSVISKKQKLGHHWKQHHASHQKPQLLLTNTETEPSSVLSKRHFRRADTNIVSVNFETLLSPGNMHAGEPTECSKCHAILSHISKVDSNSKRWKCEFCGEPTEVDISPKEIPASEDVTFLLEPALTTSTCNLLGIDQSLVVFCVDTSGSMCVTTKVSGQFKLRGTNRLKRLQSFNEENESQYLPSQHDRSVTYISRLQAVQAAVDHQLVQMSKDHPHRRLALITFNNEVFSVFIQYLIKGDRGWPQFSLQVFILLSLVQHVHVKHEVTIIGDGTQTETVVAGDKLTNEELLHKIGSEFMLPKAVKDSSKILGEKVYNLEEGGATALGPALVIAVSMAAHHPGSKVILCTDGKANIGLGKLEEAADEQAALEFYTTTATTALEKGVTVSVITIGGTDCKLVHLGMLADKTGGQVNIVDPLKLTEEFGNILADPIIATKVKATFILHKELYVINENDPDSQLCRMEQNVGNVHTSSTITFEFSRRQHPKGLQTEGEERLATSSENSLPTGMPSANKPAVMDFPFQLQIEYTDTEGNKALRVITRSMPATTQRKVTEENANLEILGMHAAKKSAELALQGQFSKSRSVALLNQRLAWRQCHSDAASDTDRKKYKNIYKQIQNIENTVHSKLKQEIKVFGYSRSDSESSEDETGELPTIKHESNTDKEAPALPSRSGIRAKQFAKANITPKSKKVHSKRSADMDDGMANMMYRFRSVGANEMSALAIYDGTVASGSEDKGATKDLKKTTKLDAYQQKSQITTLNNMESISLGQKFHDNTNTAKYAVENAKSSFKTISHNAG